MEQQTDRHPSALPLQWPGEQWLKKETNSMFCCQSETYWVIPHCALFPKLLVQTHPWQQGHCSSHGSLMNRMAATAAKKLWLCTAKCEFSMTLLGLWLTSQAYAGNRELSNSQEKNWLMDIQQDTMMVILICFETQVLTLDTALILMFKSHSRAGWKMLMCESKWHTWLSVLLVHPARYSSTRAKRCLHILSIYKLQNCIREDTTVLLKWIHGSIWASNQWSWSVICSSGMKETGPLEKIAAITLWVQEVTTDVLKPQENAEDEKPSPGLQKISGSAICSKEY